MNILALCSALNNTYIALQKENNIYSKIIKSDEDNYHSLYLIKEIQKICNENNFKLNDLDFIVTNAGPGSFTGIRVALSVAKVMAQELNLPVIGLNSAEILLSAFKCDTLIMDARRDMYYVASKNKIDLVYKNNLPKLKGEILTDKRCSNLIKGSICFEDKDLDLGKTMIQLGIEKYSNSESKNEFNYLNLNANYIQTPPIFAN